MRRAEAIERQAAVERAKAARREARLNRRAGAGATAGAEPVPAIGDVVDPARLVDLAIFGVIGAAAVSALSGDGSAVAEARVGARTPTPGGGGPPSVTPSTTAVQTD